MTKQLSLHPTASADDNPASPMGSGVPNFVACAQSIAMSTITGPIETKDTSIPSPGRQADCDSSCLRWSNDPEKEYFQYVRQQEQERRAQQGKPSIDSLMGDSTIGEIIGNKAKQEPSVCFDGYSLATKELASVNKRSNSGTSFPLPEQAPPDDIQPTSNTFLPDAPSTICTWEQHNQGGGSRKEDNTRDNRQLYIVVGLVACVVLGCVTVVVSLAAMYVVDNTANLSMDTAEDLGFPVNSINFPTPSPSNRVEEEPKTTTTMPVSAYPSLRPSSRPELNLAGRPTLEPVITPLPTFAPSRDPKQSLRSPTANPTSVPVTPLPTSTPPTDSTPAEKPVPASPPRPATRAPTASPVSARPTDQPTRPPTLAPTTSPVTDVPTFQPTTRAPTFTPTSSPVSAAPTDQPTRRPALAPTPSPTDQPTRRPTLAPTASPTDQLTRRPTLAPTPSPVTVEPTEQPTGRPTPFLPPVQIVAPTPRPGNAAPLLPANRLDLRLSPDFPLRRCEGDCDTDDDCQQGLVCLQRSQNELPVPGCIVGANDDALERTNTDFCVPTPRPASAANDLDLRFGLTFPLKQCEGDCDTDYDCQEGLVCLQRERGQLPIRGCLIGANPDRLEETRTDFCVPENMRQ